MIPLLLILSGVSIFIGVGDLSASQLSFDNEEAWELFFISRWPRTAAIILTGASITICGVIMQLLLRNRFVEPSTTGTTEATMIGLLIVAVWFPDWSLFGKMSIAATCSLIGLLVFLKLAQNLPREQPLLIPLVGLIYGGILGAVATYFAFQTDLLQYLGVWLTGEFSGVIAGRYELLWIAGALTLFCYLIADRFTIVGLGERASKSLGLNYQSIVLIGVATVAITSSLVVVTVGVLPFIGLVVPNLVSRFMGDNLRESLPLVAGYGAIFTLFSDIVGRTIRYPYEIPAGTVFGVVGAVIFLWMILGRKNHV
ncbi:iron chelate uptake ABC transporter family permease subunit [Marinomonas sp. C2222]|uniref:Iron chelate uptake ABC transporter family permease subunit n=1 Tax=Marinomonas sargassi TaxID=2984494 RepID=A0ABT2YUP4_9GAMM|nr:iron chelate uptake ABC transporter family permease subunit [Marinomonas sargassi]MCV2403620.1 iron chelate uptake ABC transporter family permease subunit [Marinomonas sargassi]